MPVGAGSAGPNAFLLIGSTLPTTGVSEILSTTGDWTKETWTYTVLSPQNGDVITVELYTPGGIGYFDDVSLTCAPVGCASSSSSTPEPGTFVSFGVPRALILARRLRLRRSSNSRGKWAATQPGDQAVGAPSGSGRGRPPHKKWPISRGRVAAVSMRRRDLLPGLKDPVKAFGGVLASFGIDERRLHSFGDCRAKTPPKAWHKVWHEVCHEAVPITPEMNLDATDPAPVKVDRAMPTSA